MQEHYKLYKGLQRPLVFKFFKGKYIYWAAGSIVAGMIGAGITSSVFSSLTGIITLIAITVPLLLYTTTQQKKGLHTKKREVHYFIIQSKFRLQHERKKSF